VRFYASSRLDRQCADVVLLVWQYFVVHFGDDTFLAYTHA